MKATHCPKCRKEYGYEVMFTEHHVLPRRFFPGSALVVDLCRTCHDELEKRIPLKEKMPANFYYLVVNNFLGYKLLKEQL